MASVDFNRILVSLNNAHIQTKQPALYQTIQSLITSGAQLQDQLQTQIVAITDSTKNLLTWGTEADRAAFKPQVTGHQLIIFYTTDTAILWVFANGVWSAVSSDNTATYLTVTDETASLPNSRAELAGSGIEFDDSIPGERTVNAVIRSVRLILTNAQIKALQGTPIDIIPAPGVGFWLRLISVDYSSDFSAGAYTNIDPTYSDFRIGYNVGVYAGGYMADDPLSTPPLTQITDFFGSNSQKIVPGVPYSEGYTGSVPGTGSYIIAVPNLRTSFENLPLQVCAFNSTGDLTGGNVANTLTIDLQYCIRAL